MPESIRWAAEVGNKKKVEEAVKRLEKCGLEPEVNFDAIQEDKPTLKQNLKAFFSRTYARQVAFIFWIGAAYALTVNLVSVYSSKVLSDLGASSFESLLGTLSIDILGTFGVLITVFAADKLGRKVLGTLGFGLSAIPLAVLYVAYLMGFLSIPLVVAMFSLFFLINVGFVGTLQYVPAGEVFPTRLRGLSVGWEKLFEFGLALPALSLYAFLGVANSLLYDIIVAIIAAAIYYFLSLETKQMPLEEIQRRYTGNEGIPSFALKDIARSKDKDKL
ncbi:MFS transporter [Acidianus brierleyi]|uniref:Major facilitator superfamily (MFS) profile domain-containing protein n=2 Tax=Acidianus brierleyi TaxID=41673 RepID=A0A2U9IHG3_9CREN|nr:MFS transporter [Acidianus brierleyi]